MLRREQHRREVPGRITNMSLTESACPSAPTATSELQALTAQAIHTVTEAGLRGIRRTGARSLPALDGTRSQIMSAHDQPSASRSRWTVGQSPVAMNASPAHTRSLAARYTCAHEASNHRISSGNSTPCGTPGHGSRTTQPPSSVSYHTAGSTPAHSRRLRRVSHPGHGRSPLPRPSGNPIELKRPTPARSRSGNSAPPHASQAHDNQQQPAPDPADERRITIGPAGPETRPLTAARHPPPTRRARPNRRVLTEAVIQAAAAATTAPRTTLSNRHAVLSTAASGPPDCTQTSRPPTGRIPRC